MHDLTFTLLASFLVLGLLMTGCQRHSPAPAAGTLPQRTGVVTVRGKPLTLLGPALAIGQPAPDFVALANDQSDFRFSAAYPGKIVVLSSVPSLDTSVCDRETRRFNEEAGRLSDSVVVLTLSMDLPFAQKRWCGSAGIDRVVTLSDHRDASFGQAYGVLIKETRLLARAVFVVDRQRSLRYVEIVPDLSREPDYPKIMDQVRLLETAKTP